MKKFLVYLMFVLAILGLFDASYLTYEHYMNKIPPCTNSVFADCGKVLGSSYSTVFGIPLALIGFVHYSLLMAMLTSVLLSPSKNKTTIFVFQSTGGFLSSLYFIFLQLFIIRAVCLYCMVSAIISTLIFILSVITFFHSFRFILIYITYFLYKRCLKRIFFLFNPEKVHIFMVLLGEVLGTTPFISKVTSTIFSSKDAVLQQTIAGINFSSPIGLAAGFDYEARLTQTLAPWGFGFQTVGTITYKPYTGNPRPMLGRLPKSKSLMVNKGFKNLGAKKTVLQLKNKKFLIPVGISIGRTNSRKLTTQAQSVKDISNSFMVFEKSNLKHSYYELNISCPNLYGNVTFYPPKNLNALLRMIDRLKVSRPIFIKMPIEKSNEEFLQMLEVIVKHNVVGVIIGNLQKNRSDPNFNREELAQFKVGSFSGKPTFDRSNELISLTYKHYKNKLVIIGCGGVFNAEDAIEKIRRGATLVQLITGIIFEGPQLVSQINAELGQKLRSKNYLSIQQLKGVTKI